MTDTEPTASRVASIDDQDALFGASETAAE